MRKMRQSQGRCSKCRRPCAVGCVRPAYCGDCKNKLKEEDSLLSDAAPQNAPYVADDEPQRP